MKLLIAIILASSISGATEVKKDQKPFQLTMKFWNIVILTDNHDEAKEFQHPSIHALAKNSKPWYK